MFAALAFLANVFVGLWLLVMVAGWVALQYRSLRVSQFVVPALLFVLIAAPLLVWVSMAVGSRDAAVDFSCRVPAPALPAWRRAGALVR